MERSALERELEALHAQSHSWALACCGYDEADAEDALQAAYLKVLEGRARYAGRSSFRTWLFAVIRRTAAEQRRRRWLYRRHRNGARPEATHEPAVAETRIERAEQAERVTAALRSLSQRQREVLELVFYHDMTIEEAAAVLGVSVGTARTHYTRGKENMRRLLERDD